jgi:hypothetical protein
MMTIQKPENKEPEKMRGERHEAGITRRRFGDHTVNRADNKDRPQTR